MATLPRDLPRVASAADLAMRGIPRSAIRTELRRGRWDRLGPGVLLTAPGRPTRSDWIKAGLLLAGARSALSGRDAVAIHRLQVRWPESRPALVLARDGRHRTLGDVHIRPTDRAFTTSFTSSSDFDLPGIAVVAPARAVADAALGARRFEAVQGMVTAAVQRGLCTIDDLIAELDCGPRNGSGFLRRAIDDVVQGARSVAEAESLAVLRMAGLPRFELNVALVDARGIVLYRADVLWRELRAILEVDSRERHFLEPDWRATMRRHNTLTAAGLAVTHYPPTVIRNLGLRWADEVGRWLRRRADELGVPYLPAGDRWRPPRDPEPYVLTSRD